MKSKGTQTKVMRTFRNCIARFSADRPQYVAAFFALWEGTAHEVANLAEQLLQHQEVEFSKGLWDRILLPYSTFQIMLFSRLMDKLGLDEEERYLAACSALDAAWQQFFSTVLVRHPDAMDVVARLEAARHSAHDAVVPLFTGEALPALTPAWANAYMALEDNFNDLAEAVRK